MPLPARVRALPIRRLAGALALLGPLAARAEAACTLSACSAAPVISACCTATTCTLDGTITVSGPTCTFDFGVRSVTLSGTMAAQGRTITLKQKSLKLLGLIDVRGPGGGAAGNVTIVTTGGTGTAFSQEGGTSAIIEASSTAGPGGVVTIQADGDVVLTRGTISANGGTLSSGGVVDVRTTVGDVSVAIPVTASSQASPVGGRGFVNVSAPDNVTVTGSGRLVADLGSVFVDAGGAASFADGSVVQANGGGDVTMVAGALTGLGEMRAAGESGSVSLETIGDLFLSRLSQGVTVGAFGSVTLATETGALTIDAPILALSATVEATSGAALVVSRKIDVTGVNLGDGSTEGGGEVTLEAIGDVQVTRAIVGSDPIAVESITIAGERDVTIDAANLELKGGGDADGGSIAITATRDVTLTGAMQLNVLGADRSSGGSIEIDAGRHLTVGASVALIADGSPLGAGGPISLRAGVDEIGDARLPGDLLLAGDVKANGKLVNGSTLTVSGCVVSIPSGAVLDVTGDQSSTIEVTARSSLSIGGTLRATKANELTFPAGTTPTLTGTFVPARSAGSCAGGTVIANGCVRALCTGPNVPAGCLPACPQCGNGQIQFPETCDTGGGPACGGGNFCDDRCRLRVCGDTNPCTTTACDPVLGCIGSAVPNGTACDDATVCNGRETCEFGTCLTQPGSVPVCGPDTNPCTGDACDPVAGCVHPPLPNGSTPAGCVDTDLCNGTESCVGGQCTQGTPTVCPPETPICNATTGACQAPAQCTGPGDCSDGNPCTTDACVAQTCVNTPVSNGIACDDGDVCNGVRTCQSGACVPGTPLVCGDGDPCTADSCDPVAGCVTDPIEGCCATSGDCADGDACTTDACVANACVHAPLACDDGDVCTNDSCDPALGCQHVADPACCQTVGDCADDGEICTDAACVANRCQHVVSPVCCTTGADCAADPDNDPCTDNGTVCPASNRCAATPLDGTACGDACTPGTCEAGTCVPGTPVDCADGDPCTADVCTDGACSHPPIALCCETTAACVDGNVCTDDACDVDAGRCVHVVPDPTCTPCAGGDPFECGPRCQTACVAGRCQDAAADCDDGDACTDDACDAVTGCVHTPRLGSEAAACDDGDVCTDGDSTCVEPGRCVGTPKIGFASVRCRLDDAAARLGAAEPQNVNARLKSKLEKRMDAVRRKLQAAETAPRCKKAKRLLAAAARSLRGLQKTVTRVVGKRVAPELGGPVAGRLGEAAARTDELRIALGC